MNIHSYNLHSHNQNIPDKNSNTPSDADNMHSLDNKLIPRTMDPIAMDTYIHNPRTNMTAKRDNNMKIRDFGAIANYRYLHRNNSNRFDRQNVGPVDNMNLLHA